MAIEFQCPSCQTIYRAKDEYRGRSTRCKQCGETIKIEPMAATDPVPAPVPSRSATSSVAFSPSSRPAPKLALSPSSEQLAPRIDPAQAFGANSRVVRSSWGPFTKTGLPLCLVGAVLPLLAIGLGHAAGMQDVATTVAYVGLFLMFVGAGLCAVEKQWVPLGVGIGLGIFAFGIGLAFIPSDTGPVVASSSGTSGTSASAWTTNTSPSSSGGSTPSVPTVPQQAVSSTDLLGKPLPTTKPFAADTEAADRLDGPVKFNDWAISPPRRAPVLLEDFTPAPLKLVRWQVGPKATMAIRTIDKTASQTSQKRVAAESRASDAPEETAPQAVVTVKGVGRVFENAGAIAGIPFQRIVFGDSPSQFASGYYVADLGNRFLSLEVQNPSSDPEICLAFDQFARSLHKPAGDELVVDPFDNESVVARLEGKEAENVIKVMVARGKTAEPVLLRQLDRAQPAIKLLLIDALANVGTDESIPPLVRYAASPDPTLRAAARKSGAAIRPSQFNDFSLAIMDLQCGDEKSVARALNYLAHIPPNDRRDEIALLLEKVYRNSIFRKDILTDAIWRWHNDRLMYMLIDDISSGDCPDFNIETAFTLLPRTQDPDAARAIARWLTRRPDRTVDALIEFGSVAEPIAIDLLGDDSPVVRGKAVQILRSIGSEQSIDPLNRYLQRAPSDQKDLIKETIQIIQERLLSAPSRATTAPTTRP